MKSKANLAAAMDAPTLLCLRWLRLGRRATEQCCSSITWRAYRFRNPQGWQIVVGGRNGVETSGSVDFFGPRIPKGCQRSATPPGSNGDFTMRSGGIAPAFAALRRGRSLNPRLLSGKPPACSLADPKTNKAAPLDGGGASGFAFLARQPPASEPRRSPTMRAQRAKL